MCQCKINASWIRSSLQDWAQAGTTDGWGPRTSKIFPFYVDCSSGVLLVCFVHRHPQECRSLLMHTSAAVNSILGKNCMHSFPCTGVMQMLEQACTFADLLAHLEQSWRLYKQGHAAWLELQHQKGLEDLAHLLGRHGTTFTVSPFSPKNHLCIISVDADMLWR